MAKFFFVQTIANLEGYKSVEVAKSYHNVTLSNVDIRLIALEKVCQIESPPPMLEPTWDSLEYRSKRLSRWLPHRRLGVALNESVDIKPEVVHKLLVRLNPKFLATTSLEEDLSFDFSVQSVCRIAGSNGWAMPDTIMDWNQLYSATIQLCSTLNDMPYHFNSRPTGMPTKTKTCCGCCSCFCHRAGPPRPPQIIKVRRNRPARSRMSWFKNWFGKKNKRDYDSDTSSSGSSETVAVDD